MSIPFLTEHIYEHQRPVAELPVDWPQAYRYMGIPGTKEPDETVRTMAQTCLSQQQKGTVGRACYAYYPLQKIGKHALDLGFAQVTSMHLSRHLQECEGCILFAATIGAEVDRLIARDGLRHVAYPTIHHGVGAMLVEVYCDCLEQNLKQLLESEGYITVPRFSPGYGDLSLQLQTDVFRALQPHRIGITLTDTLLMRPSKSVTAIIGIRQKP